MIDAIKGIAMFRKVEVPVLGLVENMAYFVCPSCDTKTEIYGPSKVGGVAKDERVPVIGRIPIDPDVVADSDGGQPVVIAHPDSAPAKAYREIASRALEIAEAESKEPGGLGAFLDRFGG